MPILKIIISVFLTTLIFYYLINNFSIYLEYQNQYKLITIIMLVILTFLSYLLISIVTKAFKFSDIKLKY